MFCKNMQGNAFGEFKQGVLVLKRIASMQNFEQASEL
jgi:hypothetical protein